VVTVEFHIVSLFLFPDGTEVFNCLKYEAALVISELAVLSESVQAHNVTLLLGKEGLFF
jgi:hypothetical protein